MATAKELRVWIETIRRWIPQIEDSKTSEHLSRAATEMEKLAEQKQAAERQLI